MTTPKGPATEGALGELHNKITAVMANALDKVLAKQADPGEDENGNELEAPVNPALLSVITKFLAENKITCAPEAGNAMSDLEQKLAKKQATRRAVGNVTYIEPEG